MVCGVRCGAKGHFTHETESPWPLHFKHSHWWKRWSWCKFASYYARGTNGVCECKMDVRSTYIPTWHQNGSCFTVTWTISKNHILEVGLTHNWETMAFQTLRTWFILFDHVWGPLWIKSHWNSIWLRARSFMTSHYTWGSVSTLHDFGGVLGRPSETFFWALTISWSRLLACVWSDSKNGRKKYIVMKRD